MKTRLDQLLVERGLAESRERAQRTIRAGLVYVDGQLSDKPGRPVDPEAAVEVRGAACPYVSRGGLKLAGALARFGLEDLAGARALDLGASTGGFTDCLLQHGAAHVWAIDVGRAQLHERLRADPRVTSRERLNARNLTADGVDGEPIDLVTIDVSFISLRLILPAAASVLAPGGRVVALVKPQFEADRRAVRRGGVVRDRAVHRRVLAGMAEYARSAGWGVLGVCPSPLAGPAGNREFFLCLARSDQAGALGAEATQIEIERTLDETYNDGESPRGGVPEARGPRDTPAIPNATQAAKARED